MATLGRSPGAAPLTTADIPDNSITAAKVTADVATQAELDGLVDSAPGALNTLNELAAALNDDASFSTTVTNSIATKLPLAGGTMTGNIVMGDDTSIGIADDAERIEFDAGGDISVLGANLGVGHTGPLALLDVGGIASAGSESSQFICAKSVDGEAHVASFVNSLAASGGSTNETIKVDFRFMSSGSGTNLGTAIVVGKEADHTDAANVDNYMAFHTSLNNSLTEKLRITSDGKGVSKFTAKAWCNYNHYGDSVRNSHNISTVDDVNDGLVQYNFDVDLANANFTAFASSSGSHTGATTGSWQDLDNNSPAVYNYSASSIRTAAYKGGYHGLDWISLIAFGD